MTTAVVIGGGWAGLMAAVELERRDVSVTLIEASDRVGGIAQTVIEDGYTLEPAVPSFQLPHPHLSPIVQAAGIEADPPIGEGTRWLVRGGALVPLTPSPAVLTQPFATVSAKLRMLTEPFVRSVSHDDETVLTFMQRRFGTELGSTVATVMSAGVYAGDPAALSVRSAFPDVVASETGHGSVIRAALARRKSRPDDWVPPRPHYPPTGMSAAATQMGASLRDVRLGSTASAVIPSKDGWEVHADERIDADHVVVAVDPENAQALLPADVAARLPTVRHSPVAVVGLGGSSDELPIPDGFGFLVGPGERTSSLGVLFESRLSVHRAPSGHHLVRAMLGGALQPEMVDWSDNDLVATAATDLSRLLRTSVSPSWTKVVRHWRGIPQFNVGHRKAVKELDDACARHNGLHLTGWGYRAVGLASLATDVAKIADRIA